GGSVMSQSDLRLHFGIGDATRVDLIEIKWPTTWKIERFMNIPANQILTIKEGSGIIRESKRAEGGRQ
ncbi:MAG TPA: ASPIC/UnbV domain-containing protein, partial [Terriglobia bacterium]|nr:ASPIC/UnbV domain-containing protein [Terriglobia bacterium]